VLIGFTSAFLTSSCSQFRTPLKLDEIVLDRLLSAINATGVKDTDNLE
jgi:hypothetical protein